MSALRALLADDEAPARRKLRSLLAREEVEVIGEAADGVEAVDAVRSLAPDVVLLDVQMPGLDGFEVLEAIGADAMPPVVFVTAFDEHALRAFEVAAVDYLLKPVGASRLARALERVRARRGSAREESERLLAAARPGPRALERLVARRGDRLVLVDVKDVFRLSAEGNYVEIHAGGERYLVRETLARLEARLDPARFARVHRSEVVAREAVREIRPAAHGDALLVLRDGETLRLSRRYREGLLRGLTAPAT